MKVFINIFSLAFMALVVGTTEFGEEIYLFLPSLRNPEPPPSCSVNEYWKVCVSECSNCEQRGKCIATTCRSGCDCAYRFYRVTPDGPCEPVARCPQPECGENEVFRACGPACETCSTLPCRMISCDHKCYCKEGYRRNDEGLCIPQEECPKRIHCTKNEVWSSSGPAEEFCLEREKEDGKNRTQDVEQCYCKEGYKRNVLGYCEEEKRCLRESLLNKLKKEIYQDCVPACNTTCRNYGNPNCTEDDNCYPGYVCQSGYVMNDFQACIPLEECNLDLSQVKIMDSVPDYEDDVTTPDTNTTLIFKEEESGNTTASDTLIVTTDVVSITTDRSIDSYENHTTVLPSQETIEGVESDSEEKSKTLDDKETKNINASEAKEVSKYDDDDDDDDTFDNEKIQLSNL